jgi:hypothetical protein
MMVLMFFQSEIFSHLFITFAYFFLVSILRFKLDWGLLNLWLGALVGTFFLDIDHFVYWFITHPEEEDSQEAKEIVSGFGGIKGVVGKIKKLFFLVQKVHNSHNRLILHSVIGQVILFVLTVFVITSGGSIFGSAFVMAINLHLLKDEWTDYLKNKAHLADWLFWQVREPRLKEYLGEYLVAASLIFLGLTGLLVRGG